MLDIEKCEQVSEEDAEGYNTRHWDRQWEQQRNAAVAERSGVDESKLDAKGEKSVTTLDRWGEGALFRVKPLGLSRRI